MKGIYDVTAHYFLVDFFRVRFDISYHTEYIFLTIDNVLGLKSSTWLANYNADCLCIP